MASRFIHGLAVLALLIQCSPLRTCAVAKLALGANCHDGDPAGVLHSSADAGGATGVVEGVSAQGPVHRHACVCERPKPSVEGAKPAAGAGVNVFALPAVLPPLTDLAPVGPCFQAARGPAPAPPLALQLPLLC